MRMFNCHRQVWVDIFDIGHFILGYSLRNSVGWVPFCAACKTARLRRRCVLALAAAAASIIIVAAGGVSSACAVGSAPWGVRMTITTRVRGSPLWSFYGAHGLCGQLRGQKLYPLPAGRPVVIEVWITRAWVRRETHQPVFGLRSGAHRGQ